MNVQWIEVIELKSIDWKLYDLWLYMIVDSISLISLNIWESETYIKIMQCCTCFLKFTWKYVPFTVPYLLVIVVVWTPFSAYDCTLWDPFTGIVFFSVFYEYCDCIYYNVIKIWCVVNSVYSKHYKTKPPSVSL